MQSAVQASASTTCSTRRSVSTAPPRLLSLAAAVPGLLGGNGTGGRQGPQPSSGCVQRPGPWQFSNAHSQPVPLSVGPRRPLVLSRTSRFARAFSPARGSSATPRMRTGLNRARVSNPLAAQFVVQAHRVPAAPGVAVLLFVSASRLFDYCPSRLTWTIHVYGAYARLRCVERRC